VPVLTEQAVRSLAGFKGEEAPVTSCYLDVDGSRFLRHQDYELELDRLLRQARARGNGDAATGSVAADLHRIEEYVKRGFDRSGVRGLALFSCTAHGLWKVVPLPVPVRSEVVVNHSPYVRPLEAVLDEYQRFGVLLADRQRARMFVLELGELVEKDELFEQLPRHDDDGGTWRKDHVRDHAAELAHQHLRHAADVAFHLFQEQPFDRLIIGAPEEIAGELARDLHPYLRDRLAARVSVPIAASDDEVRQAAMDVHAAVEREQEAELVARLREAVGAGQRGVAGLGPVLQALVERRVDTLLVSHGFAEPGWRCGACEFVAMVGRQCPVCEGTMHQVDDVVEEAVEDALNQSCKVEICVDNADLDVLGRIGALLRY
jgi:peptide chain release factor subunit 1